MSHILYRNDEHAMVEADLKWATFSITWKKQVTSEIMRRIYIQSYMQVRKDALRSYIVDPRNKKEVLAEDERWFMTDLLPRMVSAGLERIAIIRNEKGKLAALIRRNSKAASDVLGCEIRVFGEPSEASSWIQDGVEIHA